MHWKEQLQILENKGDWNAIANFIQKVIAENPNDVEAYVIGMYLLWDFLLESYDTKYRSQKVGRQQMENLLKQYYKESSQKFSDNAEYLFFVGYFSVGTGWLLGLPPAEEDTIPLAMRKKAAELEPENILYQWSYRMSIGDMESRKSLAQQMLKEKKYIEWLKTKGSLGKYIIEAIEICAKQ